MSQNTLDLNETCDNELYCSLAAIIVRWQYPRIYRRIALNMFESICRIVGRIAQPSWAPRRFSWNRASGNSGWKSHSNMNMFVVEIVSSYTWSKVATKDARSALFTRQSHYPLFLRVSNKSRSIPSAIMSLTIRHAFALIASSKC